MTTAQTSTPTPTPGVRPAHLRTLRGVRREFSRLYCDARNGLVAPAIAAKLAYVLSLTQKAVEAEVIEQRLDEIEEQLAATGKVNA